VRLLALSMLSILALAALAPLGARGEAVVGAVIVLAPVGYIYVLERPVGDVVGVYVGGSYEPYKARTGDTSKLFHLTELEAVLTPGGVYRLNLIRLGAAYPVVGVNLPGGDDLVLLTVNGLLYTSPYHIFLAENYPPPWWAPTDRDVVVGHVIDLRVERGVSYIVPVAGPNTRVTVVTRERAETVSVVSLLGLPSGCLVFVNPSKGFPWYGGLLPSPPCMEGVTGIVKDVYNEQPLYTIFVKAVEGRPVLFAFSDVTSALLARLGFLSPIGSDPSVHVVRTALDGANLYFIGNPLLLPVKVEVVNAVDSTVLVGEERFCVLPSDAEVLLYLGWGLPSSKPLRTKLEPGEVILYRLASSNQTYICRGDLSFLDAPPPSIVQPSIKQLRQPAGFSSGVPVLVMLGNGKFYYGTKFSIPYSDYDGNVVFVLSMHPYVVNVEPASLWSMPVFWISLLLFALFAAMLIQRPRAQPRKLQIVWDIATPPPLEFADRETVARKVSQFIDIHGVCPDDVELAEMGALLPAEGEKPTDEVVVCNFKTNPETEKLLRRVVRVANDGFWAFKRRGRNYGFLYTLVGDTLITFYLYKQENEKTPARLLLNAIRSAMRTYIGVPLYTQYHGLIIVAEPGMARAAREEFVRAGVINEDWGVVDIRGYLSVKLQRVVESLKGGDREEREARLKRLLDRVVEFAKAKIPLIVIVGDDVRVLIEVLGEVASRYYEEYLKVRGIKDVEGQE